MKSDGVMFDCNNWILLFDGFKLVFCFDVVLFNG